MELAPLALRPAAQAVQEALCSLSLYLPASHTVQDAAPDSLKVPAWHLEQLEAPPPLYLPLSHDEQLV